MMPLRALSICLLTTVPLGADVLLEALAAGEAARAGADLDRAAGILEAALAKRGAETSPHRPRALVTLAEISMERGDPEAALHAAREAEAQGGVGESATYVAAYASSAMGDASDVVERLEPLERRSSLEPALRGLLASAYIETGRTKEGHDLLESLVDEDDAHEATFRLGVAAFEGGEMDRAVGLLRRARVHPGAHRYYAAIYEARALLRLRRPREAREAIDAVASGNASPEIEYLTARCAEALGDLPAAETAYRAALAADPSYLEAVYALAQARRRAGDADEARSLFETHRELQQRSWTYQRDASALEEDARAKPDDVELARRVADLHLSGGDPSRAERWAWTALRRAPSSTEARQTLARALARMGRYGEAAVQYQKILRRDPTHAARAELEELIRRHARPRSR